MALFNPDELAALRISRMVVHEVGPKDTDLRLFNGVISPVPHQELFLARLSDANRGSAYRFKDGSRLLGELHKNEDKADMLEEVGKDLTRAFHNLHKGNAKAGTLAIFEIESPTRSLYGIIKFDNIRGVSVSADADVHAKLSLLGSTISEAKDTMQKAALIRITADGGDLTVSDKYRPVSGYFEDFLGAARLYSQTELTTQLSKALYATADKQRNLIENRVFEDLPMRVYSAIQDAEEFNPRSDTVITAVFGALPADSPIRETFVEQLAARRMEDEDFALVKEAISRPTRRRLTTLEGVVLTYGMQLEGTNVQIDVDEETTRAVITIRTEGIKEREQLP